MLPPGFPYHSSSMTYRPPILPHPYPGSEMVYGPFLPHNNNFTNPNPTQISTLPPTQIKPEVLYKTKLCSKFQIGGSCSYGCKCMFAHGAEELRDQSLLFHKTKHCSLFKNFGLCVNGSECTFAHGVQDRREPPPEMQISALLSAQIKNSRFYKTKLCLHFQNGRLCPNGSECTFAHGAQDLRGPPPERQINKLLTAIKTQKNYKSKLCLNFHMGGSCANGSMCPSAHGIQNLRETSPELQNLNGNIIVVKLDSGSNCPPQIQSNKREVLPDQLEHQPLQKKPRLLNELIDGRIFVKAHMFMHM